MSAIHGQQLWFLSGTVLYKVPIIFFTPDASRWIFLRLQIGKMASADMLKRLETRAVAAEQLIQILRQQIDQVKVNCILLELGQICKFFFQMN